MACVTEIQADMILFAHVILHIQVILFFILYLLSIVLSPAVLDGPEWNAITCTQKQKNSASLRAVHDSVAWFCIAVNVYPRYFEMVICKALPLNA